MSPYSWVPLLYMSIESDPILSILATKPIAPPTPFPILNAFPYFQFSQGISIAVRIHFRLILCLSSPFQENVYSLLFFISVDLYKSMIYIFH